MLAFFGFGTSSDDTETPAPRTPSLLDALLGTPTQPADEIDTLAALHTKFRDDLASAPLDDLRKAANEAASLSANDRAAGGWRLDAAARLRAEPEVQTRDESETYGGWSPVWHGRRRETPLARRVDSHAAASTPSRRPPQVEAHFSRRVSTHFVEAISVGI